MIVPARPALCRYCVGLVGGDLRAGGRRLRVHGRLGSDAMGMGVVVNARPGRLAVPRRVGMHAQGARIALKCYSGLNGLLTRAQYDGCNPKPRGAYCQISGS